MNQRRYRIGAIHALVGSIQPTQVAFERGWPAADVAHVLDGSLYLDRSRGTVDEAELISRISRLITYSASTGVEGIIMTGSFFGNAVKQARAGMKIPVATSFEGLIERALALDQPLQVLATAPDSVKLLTEELQREARRRSRGLTLAGQAVEGAMDALIGGYPDQHDALVLEAVRSVDAKAAVLFAQFSMERALSRCAAARSGPVIGPAGEGVAWMRKRLTSGGSRKPRVEPDGG